MIEPMVEGTRNVTEASVEMGVKPMVFTYSNGVVYMNPHNDPRSIVDDDHWSHLDYCIHTNALITLALTTHKYKHKFYVETGGIPWANFVSWCGQNWYNYAKTLEEKFAWEIAERRNLDMVVINPCLVVGPLLQSTMNGNTDHIYAANVASTKANLLSCWKTVPSLSNAYQVHAFKEKIAALFCVILKYGELNEK